MALREVESGGWGDKEWEMAKFIHFFVHCTDRDHGPDTALQVCRDGELQCGIRTHGAMIGLNSNWLT